VADRKTSSSSSDKRVIITSPEVVAYLTKLASIGVYGRKPGAVATWIVRKEIARLLERRVLLNPIEFLPTGNVEERDDEESD
jgi:hypothetical protein